MALLSITGIVAGFVGVFVGAATWFGLQYPLIGIPVFVYGCATFCAGFSDFLKWVSVDDE